MKLDDKLDEILDLFADGDAFRVVAKKMNVSTRTLHKFLSLPENQELYKGVLQESSDSYASLAEEVLINSPADRVEIQRARELAQHYRWMASKRNPKKYGDRIDIDHTTKGKEIVSASSFKNLSLDDIKKLEELSKKIENTEN